MIKRKNNNLFIKSLIFNITNKILKFNKNYIIEKNIKNNSYFTKKNYKTLSKTSVPLLLKNIKKSHFLLHIRLMVSILDFNTYKHKLVFIQKNIIGLKNSIPLLIKINNLIFNSLTDFQYLIEFFKLFLFLIKLNYILHILIINKKTA